MDKPKDAPSTMDKLTDVKVKRFYVCAKEEVRRPVHQTCQPCKPGRKKVSNKTVITGGAGYFGFTLGCALAKSGTKVILYDIKQPIWDIPKGMLLIQSDVRNYSDLYSACEGVDCVIHAAAYGMTGIEQLHRKHIRSVNIGGTGIVLEVCKRQGIPRLIYTSSINVVFAGQTIIDGDEATVPYFPLEQQTNEYSRTKSIAEQMVLAANGSLVAGGGKLHTCAIRPPGIYGPEEQRHLPRLALNIERGIFFVRFGNPANLMNWVHVKNLVQAHILAADALTPEKNYIADGQAYFVHDGEKVNLFEWLAPLFKGLGGHMPTIHAPIFMVYISAVLMESIHNILLPIVEITPLITRNEINNMSCMHTFSINKAQAHLGYVPKKYLFANCVDYYLSKGPRPRNFFMLKCFTILGLFIGLILLALKFEEVRAFLVNFWRKYRYCFLEM